MVGGWVNDYEIGSKEIGGICIRGAVFGDWDKIYWVWYCCSRDKGMVYFIFDVVLFRGIEEGIAKVGFFKNYMKFLILGLLKLIDGMSVLFGFYLLCWDIYFLVVGSVGCCKFIEVFFF